MWTTPYDTLLPLSGIGYAVEIVSVLTKTFHEILDLVLFLLQFQEESLGCLNGNKKSTKFCSLICE